MELLVCLLVGVWAKHLAGRSIPCGKNPGRICDAYGFEIGRATLPGNDDTRCHDGCGRELFDLIPEATFRIELQPRHLFTTLIPPAILLTPGRPPSIVPDASIHVSLPAAATARGSRRGGALPFGRRLFDVKTIHGGTAHYYSAHAADERAGAVRHREHTVNPDYLRHARYLDGQFHAGAGSPGPVEQRLTSHTAVRGLVYGQYGEASADVHDLIRQAADALAEDQWRTLGARSQAELRGFLISRSRRRIGLAVVQAMARHRLARVPYIGVPRVAVAQRAQWRGAAAAMAAHRRPQLDASDFYQFQQAHQAH